MKIEEQVLTIEQMQHLKELGVEVKDTALCWVFDTKIIHGFPKSTVSVRPYDDNILCSVFVSRIVFTLTLQEILKMLPHSIKMDGCSRNVLLYDSIADGLIWYESYFGNKVFESDAETFLEAAYETLCWVSENGYLNKE